MPHIPEEKCAKPILDKVRLCTDLLNHERYNNRRTCYVIPSPDQKIDLRNRQIQPKPEITLSWVLHRYLRDCRAGAAMCQKPVVDSVRAHV